MSKVLISISSTIVILNIVLEISGVSIPWLMYATGAAADVIIGTIVYRVTKSYVDKSLEKQNFRLKSKEQDMQERISRIGTEVFIVKKMLGM